MIKALVRRLRSTFFGGDFTSSRVPTIAPHFSSASTTSDWNSPLALPVEDHPGPLTAERVAQAVHDDTAQSDIRTSLFPHAQPSVTVQKTVEMLSALSFFSPSSCPSTPEGKEKLVEEAASVEQVDGIV